MNNEQKADLLPSASLVQNGLLAEAKFRPILFSTDMVQAILEGRKTQTRRIVKPQPNDSDVCRMGGTKNYAIFQPDDVMQIKPKFNVGDVLWVRETWQKLINNEYPCNLKDAGFAYKATDIYPEIKWKPSIFMPKDACRIFLKITNIKVERLQDISERDAIKEGVNLKNISGDWEHSPVQEFEQLWQKINGRESWEANPFVWVIRFERCEHPPGFC